MDLVTEVCNYISSQTPSLGTYNPNGVGGNIFDSDLPDSPDVAIAVRNTGGVRSPYHSPLDSQTIQIIIRGTENPLSGRDLSQKIYDILHGRIDPLTEDGVILLHVVGMQAGPNFLGRDTKNRVLYSLNFEIVANNPTREY